MFKKLTTLYSLCKDLREQNTISMMPISKREASIKLLLVGTRFLLLEYGIDIPEEDVALFYTPECMESQGEIESTHIQSNDDLDHSNRELGELQMCIKEYTSLFDKGYHENDPIVKQAEKKMNEAFNDFYISNAKAIHSADEHLDKILKLESKYKELGINSPVLNKLFEDNKGKANSSINLRRCFRDAAQTEYRNTMNRRK